MPSPNLLAVLVAGLVPMIVGSLWYGPLFGKKWMEMVGKTEEEIRANSNPLKQYGVMFVLGLLASYVIAHNMTAYADAYGATGWLAGLQAGFWLWLGLILWHGWQAVAFEDKPLGLYALNMGYNLVALVGMAVVLGLML